jgi:hypothetical protein
MGVDGAVGAERAPDEGDARGVGQFDRLAGGEGVGDDERESGAPGLEGEVGADATREAQDEVAPVDRVLE